jgi:hypothetical protein
MRAMTPGIRGSPVTASKYSFKALSAARERSPNSRLLNLKKIRSILGIPILLPFFTRIGGEVHHPTRYGWEPRLAVIGVQAKPDPEAERVFRELVNRNAINMHARVRPFILRGSEADGRWEDGLESLLSESAPAAGIEVRL